MMVKEAAVAGIKWQAPGPGHWANDDSHIPGTVPPFMDKLLTGAMSDGFRQGFRQYGYLLDGFEIRLVNHRMYMQPRIVGQPAPAPGKGKPAGGPPPKFVFNILFVLHPELRYRKRQATKVFADRPWREEYRRWQAVEAPQQRRTNLALQKVELAKLDEAGLRSHLADAYKNMYDGFQRHFALIPTVSIPVGDWLTHTLEWTGATAFEALAVLKGTSASSVESVGLLQKLSAAVNKTPAARDLVLAKSGDPAQRVAALRETSAEVREALDAYLEEFGWQMFSGVTMESLVLNEMPQLLINTIVAGFDQNFRHISRPKAAIQLRDRVPVGYQAEYDRLLEEARFIYGFRDENVNLLASWTFGLMRRALLEAGQRLFAQGILLDARHIVEASPEEVQALFGGPGLPPTGMDLAARAAVRTRLGQLEAPGELGEPGGPPPPAELFPAAVARVMRAGFAFINLLEDARPAKTAEKPPTFRPSVKGQGVSEGVYEGQARIVSGPTDFEKIRPGDVLVARTTSPAYNVVLPLLGAIVTDRGGLLCHAAIVAREFGLPGVVGTHTATTTIPDGARVRVDGAQGTVEVIG